MENKKLPTKEMELIKGKCPECGGILEVNKDLHTAICPYCGMPYIIEKAINNYINIYNVNNINAQVVNVNIVNDNYKNDINKHNKAHSEILKLKQKYINECIKAYAIGLCAILCGVISCLIASYIPDITIAWLISIPMTIVLTILFYKKASNANKCRIQYENS